MPQSPYDTAREEFDAVDKRGDKMPLYIGVSDDPIASLIKIREFLYLNCAHQRLVMLAVVGLERVVDSLREAK